MATLADLASGMMQQSSQPMSLADLGQYGPRVLPSDYNTKLSLLDEMAFRQWVQNNNVPFNPNAGTTDYDMRGFYQAAQQQEPGISTAINPNDHLLHYPDRFKTPQHQSFSNESQWAGPNAPRWINDSQLALPNGRIVFDEKNR